MSGSPSKVLAHKHAQHGKLTGGLSPRVVAELEPHRNYRVTVGQLTWLECCNGCIQALEKTQAGKLRNMGFNLCKGLATTNTALLGTSDKTV